jgi:hypothetical protein
LLLSSLLPNRPVFNRPPARLGSLQRSRGPTHFFVPGGV